ncbi:MAG: glutamate--tRNA ligase [Candidatus Goldbacteria bacterium]|nr:glutamate--tRNA ligase [Candidatus Goldiibacteriota bacterium]
MVRVRFAPSPTGYLHIGGARTALFNWLFAREHNGKFILRIEDTDKERSTEESLNEILRSLRWLGLNWDEGPDIGGPYGPYFQSQRLDIYLKYIDKLLDENKAYKCFCTKEELEEERKKAESEKRAFKYSGKCKNLPEYEIKQKEQAKIPYTVRIKIDQEGETVIKDKIRGEVVFQNFVLDDFIIMRADKMPVYNFVVVIDDALMQITHVIRGEDHLSNTPKQIHIYKALGFNIPEFAHIPLILGPDKSKLSKRHGETSCGVYEKNGFLPEAFINYLALLGWSPDGEKTEMSVDEIIKEFSLEKVHKAGAIFDNQKLLWLNGVYIRKKNINELTELCIPYLKESGLITDDDIKNKYEYIKKVVALQQEKIKTLSEISHLSDYFFKDNITLTEDAKKILEKNKQDIKKVIETLKNIIIEVGVEKSKVEEKIRIDMEKAGIKPKVFMHVIRVILTGTTIGPGLFDIIETLGKDVCLKRIENTLANDF